MAMPALCGVISVGAAWLLGEWAARVGYGYLVQLIVIGLAAVALNSLLAWAWMRPMWDDFWQRIWRLLPSRAVA
jgi:hypothetical protein